MIKKFQATIRKRITLFSLVMTAIMVTGMSTFNLIWHDSWSIEVFLTNFPILFVVAFLMQSFIAMPVAKKVTALHFEMTKKKSL
jgi:hypothetical protein